MKEIIAKAFLSICEDNTLFLGHRRCSKKWDKLQLWIPEKLNEGLSEGEAGGQ